MTHRALMSKQKLKQNRFLPPVYAAFDDTKRNYTKHLLVYYLPYWYDSTGGFLGGMEEKYYAHSLLNELEEKWQKIWIWGG